MRVRTVVVDVTLPPAWCTPCWTQGLYELHHNPRCDPPIWVVLFTQGRMGKGWAGPDADEGQAFAVLVPQGTVCDDSICGVWLLRGQQMASRTSGWRICKQVMADRRTIKARDWQGIAENQRTKALNY
ncbi:hypothetical protein J4Q44_G00331010 [Coregonus suidteri]|uniref:Uncharacterized protein n=1 Tax=Coregonus suidteri TaxID=861788 RepID=A0AAN8Q9W9_9TELE